MLSRWHCRLACRPAGWPADLEAILGDVALHTLVVWRPAALAVAVQDWPDCQWPQEGPSMGLVWRDLVWRDCREAVNTYGPDSPQPGPDPGPEPGLLFACPFGVFSDSVKAS